MLKKTDHSLLIGLATMLCVALLSVPGRAQALNMDGQSGLFFQPWAMVVPAPARKLGRPTVGFHIANAGPVAGDYLNVGVEEGFGNWLEFGYTRNSHTDGGDPSISYLVNFAGMNIFNAKAEILPAGFHRMKFLPAVALGGVLRTNDPFISQAIQHKNATNGDVYGVATEVIPVLPHLAVSLNGGVRGTNAQEYGYGGNTLQWQARAFGAVAFPVTVTHTLVVSPTVEVDQEPHEIKYVPGARLPTDLVYAVGFSHLPDYRWTFQVGTGHIAAHLAPGLNIKANNAIAFAANYRF